LIEHEQTVLIKEKIFATIFI